MQMLLTVVVVAIGLVTLVNALVTLALVSQARAGMRSREPYGLEPGTRAPEFEADLLAGGRVGLQDFLGRRTLFLFVAPGCAPCESLLAGLGPLVALARRAEVNVALVSKGSREQTADQVSQNEISLPTIVSPGPRSEFQRLFKLRGTPSFCLLDEDGTVLQSGPSNENAPIWQHLKTLGQDRPAAEAQPADSPSDGRVPVLS
jgi:peroxiredoxin